MSQLDEADESIKEIITEIEEREKKEREAFEKASSQEKIEKLRNYIDELGQRLDRHIEYMDGIVEKLEHKYNKLLSYVQRTTEEKDYRIVSTETMLCDDGEEVHTAILLVHGDGTITVRCSAGYCHCKYGSREF